MPASVLSRETRSPYWKYRTKNTRQNTSRLTIPNGKFSFRILRAGSSSPRRREPPGKKGGTTFAFGAVLHVSRSPCGRCPARESSARLAPTRPAPGPALPEASSDASKSKMQHWPVAFGANLFLGSGRGVVHARQAHEHTTVVHTCACTSCVHEDLGCPTIHLWKHL